MNTSESKSNSASDKPQAEGADTKAGPETVRIPLFAYMALMACVAKSSGKRVPFRKLPTTADVNGDRFSFTPMRDDPSVTVMQQAVGFVKVSGLAEKIHEAKMKSGEAHRAKESARRVLEACELSHTEAQRSAANNPLPEGFADGEYSAGRMRTTDQAVADRWNAVLEARSTYHAKETEAGYWAEMVTSLAAEQAGATVIVKKITLEDIEEGRVLPIMPKRREEPVAVPA